MRALQILQVSGTRPSQSLAFCFGFSLAYPCLGHKRLILFSICFILDKQNVFVNDFSEIRDCTGIRKSRIVNFMTVEWIRDGLKRTRKTRSGLAKALGRSPSAVTDLLNGSRRLRAEEIAIVSEYLGVEPPRLIGGGQPRHPTGRVPLVGYVGAGAIAHFYADAQGPFDEVDAPDAASSSTVAVQIRGHSLGALFDNWLVFYDDVRDAPGEDLIGRMCVCGLADGRVLVKALKRSQVVGMWTLLSNTEPPIYDVVLEWAALVREMRPR
jgi:transcriptional regulator with XRE-family HTH domain